MKTLDDKNRSGKLMQQLNFVRQLPGYDLNAAHDVIKDLFKSAAPEDMEIIEYGEKLQLSFRKGWNACKQSTLKAMEEI